MAFSKVPNTFFGPGYIYMEPVINAATETLLDQIISSGVHMPVNGFVKNGDPVYLQLRSPSEFGTGTWNSPEISANVIYYARDVAYSGAPGSQVLKFKLAATQGGSAIALATNAVTYLYVKMLPMVCFIADTSHLSPAVTGASSIEVLTELTAANANETTGDFRHVINEFLKAFKAKNDAVTPADDRSTVLRIETEEYQQGVSNVLTRAYRTEIDLTYATSDVLAES